MTAPVESSGPEDAELIHITFRATEARRLNAVLPWVLQALQDRPGLAAKQRRRREETRAALSGLLTQLANGMQPATPVEQAT